MKISDLFKRLSKPKLTPEQKEHADARKAGYSKPANELAEWVQQQEREFSWVTAKTLDPMILGAYEAFKEGRPENLQTLFIVSNDANTRIWALLEKPGTTSDIIKSVASKLPPQQRQQNIDTAFWRYIARPNDGSMAQVFLDAGASVGNNSELALRYAAASGVTEKVEFLFKKGAKFEDAIFAAELARDKGIVQNLYLYREKFTGEKAPREFSEDAMQLLKDIQTQVKELTAKVEQLQRPQPVAKPGAPKL